MRNNSNHQASIVEGRLQLTVTSEKPVSSGHIGQGMRDRTLTENSRGLVALAVCTVAGIGIIAADGLDPDTLRSHGATDWFAHLLTALIIAIGVWMIRLPIPIWSVLIGGVVPDFGHLLAFANLVESIPGSSRNGSHSLIVVGFLALIGFINRRHANVWLGVAMGALTHLWRDMGTGTVPLLWPFLDVVWGVSFWRYFAVTLGIGIALIGSGMLLDVHAKANHSR